MRFMENIRKIREGTRRQIEDGPVTVRRSASIKAIASAMAWFIMAAGVPGQADENRPEARAKDVLKVQQSDRLPDDKLADAKIAEQVKTVVRRDPDVRTVDVVVFVSGGVVTLSGTVSTPHQKSQAEQLASQVEGVTAVVNKINVSSVRP